MVGNISEMSNNAAALTSGPVEANETYSQAMDLCRSSLQKLMKTVNENPKIAALRPYSTEMDDPNVLETTISVSYGDQRIMDITVDGEGIHVGGEAIGLNATALEGHLNTVTSTLEEVAERPAPVIGF